MTIDRSTCLSMAALFVMACTPRDEPVPQRQAAAADLRASAAAMYEAYGTALSTPRRDAIGNFYHPDGAIIVFNGQARRQSRAAIDSRYRGAWSPPAFFAWEGLTFDSVGPGQVIVNGGFLWQGTGQSDTSKFIYAALVETADSGMGIRFEHETARPAR